MKKWISGYTYWYKLLMPFHTNERNRTAGEQPLHQYPRREFFQESHPLRPLFQHNIDTVRVNISG